MTVEEVAEEEQLIGERNAPIGLVVCARSHEEVVADTGFTEFGVQVAIHLIEEIVVAAIENNGQLTLLKRRYLIDYRVVVPAFGLLLFGAQLFGHAPILGEGADVDTSRGGTGCSELVLVTYADPETSVATHAEPRDGTSLT